MLIRVPDKWYLSSFTVENNQLISERTNTKKFIPLHDTWVRPGEIVSFRFDLSIN